MDTNIIKNLIRVGQVSSLNLGQNTCKVVFPDKDNTISADLIILNRGSKEDQDYWIPDIDEQVLCLFLPNASMGINSGFILGSFFNDTDVPPENSAEVRVIKFKDGSMVKHDRASGDLTIKATGNISIIAGGKVTINGATVNIN